MPSFLAAPHRPLVSVEWAAIPELGWAARKLAEMVGTEATPALEAYGRARRS
jgi:hypothetical protein